MVKPTRIDVFSELTSPQGTFDYDRCCKLLGENYDNFVRFCDAAKLIPEEIDKMDMVEVEWKGHDQRKVIFELYLSSGEKMQFES